MIAALSETSDPQIPGWFPVVMFVGMWLLVVIVLGRISGHVMLLSHFPPVDAPTRQRFRFASGNMRGVVYRHALRVALSERGLHLAPAWPFRPITHPGIPRIPWAELRCREAQPRQRRWFMKASRFEIPRLGLRFMLRGEPGLAVEAALLRARVRQ